MEDLEILNIWKSYDKKLDESLLVNRKNLEDITKLKVRSLLGSMTPLKIFTIVCGILWVGFLDVLIVNLWHVASPFFLASAGIQSFLTSLAIGIYLYQLILIHQVDITEPILNAKAKTVDLQLSTLWIDRLLFLQLPVWTTFYLSGNMLKTSPLPLLVLQLMITAIFTYVAVWLFFNIKYENRNNKWIRFIFTGKEWSAVISSMELLKENDLQETA
ncbi:hypothetical protein [Dyadobacter sp. CY312]|uniref:hypothetical protein n=1 Tax=Dyadobacter sp. CY312 TaxID=2907303 RepID=UPI001F290814|nr:hypothetical protein [Dyadobacter sp. CY312]MCE7041841.1 hypothetical protein [Dyadobacter sp. CY312]